MAITTYAELQTAVESWMDRTDLTAVIPDFITLTEVQMCRDLRVSWLEKSDDLTPSGAFVPLPADYNGMRSVYWPDTSLIALEQVSPHLLHIRYPSTATGVPMLYAIHHEEIELRPAPNSSNDLAVTYYFKPEQLSGSNASNEFLVNAPDMLLYGSLAKASEYVNWDEGIAKWTALYGRALDQLLGEEDQRSFPGEIGMRYSG